MQVTHPDGGMTTLDTKITHTSWPCPGAPHDADTTCDEAARSWAKKNSIRVIERDAK